MGWKDQLEELRRLAEEERKAKKSKQRQERGLKKEERRLTRQVCSQVEEVSKKLASNIGWAFSTDATDLGDLPTKFYIQPKPAKGDESLESLDQQIVVEVDYYDGEVRIKPPRCLEVSGSNKMVAIPFLSFTKEELATTLKDCYQGTQALAETKGAQRSNFQSEEIPGTIDLGWYWSENKDEFQMAKINEKDRATHVYVIGATGTGKTKFLEFLIQQDIEKGNGFGVIDPHGDLIEDVKGFLACYHGYYQDEEIFERVVLIDPTDPHFTVTFNPLEKLPNVSVAEQAGELVSSFRKIWSDSWGPRMEDLMRNSLIALGEGGLTLAELPYFLTERAFREGAVQRVEHPIARQYFQRFDALTDRGQLPIIEPVMNKINAFLADHRIRQMFSSPESSFNLREIIDHKKILLIKLDKGKLKGSADLLGSLLLAKIQMAAFSRSNIPQNRRTPFYLYIDEFQNFASDSFMVVLSEARKYGLSLIMAHQTLAQIAEELRSLILGNTGIQVYFRVNRHDAQLLANEAFEYYGYDVKTFHGLHPVFWTLGEEWENKTEELQKLPPRCCYAKHKIEGGLISLFTAEIEPAWEVLGMEEDEYQDYLKSLPLGKKYLVLRESLVTAVLGYLPPPTEKVEVKAAEVEKPAEVPSVRPLQEEVEELIRREPALPFREMAEAVPSEAKGERQHRYLQSLIKRMAEEKGYRAVIEESTPDGGRVDVGLEQDGKRIACEVSVTSTDEQEFSNIDKCLRAGYDRVILCSPGRRTLEKIKLLVFQRVDEPDRGKLLFLQPEELFSYLETEAATLAGKEERVKGYKVKVQYQPGEEEEKKARREAIAQVILQSLRRQKEKV
jgi:hypothetical protein